MADISPEVLAPEVILQEIESNDSNESITEHEDDIDVKTLDDDKDIYDVEDESIELTSSILINENDNKPASTSKSTVKICNICNRTLSSYRSLKRHLKIHTEDKSYTCETCKKSFRVSRNLYIHISTVHLKEKKYQCDICGKSFGFQKTLQDHILTHTNKKPHVCTICSKSFKQIGHLKSHYNTHRIFKCEICDATFNTNRHLECHNLVHTENYYMCEMCKKGFKHMGGLKRHTKIHECEIE